MIRIARGTEPPKLQKARRRRLDRAITAIHKHGTSSSELASVLDGYDIIKEDLYLAQHKKCAWCERRRDLSSSPVEHYRPKNGARRQQRCVQIGAQWRDVSLGPIDDREHYWWLTWDWENLFFSCARCNDQGHKDNLFPLMGAAATAPTQPIAKPFTPPLLAAEDPLLLDPADPSTDPLDHIRWEPSNLDDPPRLWRWSVRWLTERGRVTAQTLKLDELADEVRDHVLRHVIPRVESVRLALSKGELPLARVQWQQLLKDLLAPTESLRGPTWIALCRLCPAGLDPPERP